METILMDMENGKTNEPLCSELFTKTRLKKFK